MLPGSDPVKRFLRRLGPGLITGASDDDPSGIATYTQAGALFGFATLWTAIITLPLMIVVQHTCAKIGLVSGRGLAGVLRKYYPRKLLYAAVIGLVVANTINAGTDIAAIAAAINIFLPIPILVLVIPIAAGIVALQIWGSYRLIVKVFKWLTLSLFAYVAAALLARPDWTEVARATFFPSIAFTPEYLTTVVAIFGTTISPYLFFWEASEEVEEEKLVGRSRIAERKGATDQEIRSEKVDTVVGMIFCNLVFYFVILAAGSTLHTSGQLGTVSATEAAQALRPLAGDAAGVLFAAGIIGSGLLAVPVLTGSAAYAVAETFGWRSGLNERPQRARKFYGVIAASTLVGLGVDFVGIDPMSALYWTAVINGVLAPPLLVVVMFVSNNKHVMGKRTNSTLANVMGWTAVGFMFAAAAGMFLAWGS